MCVFIDMSVCHLEGDRQCGGGGNCAGESSFPYPGLSEIIVCQSKTTLCSATATPSTEFILRGRRGGLKTSNLTTQVKKEEGKTESKNRQEEGVWGVI